jgi:hypothetical protein
MRYRLLLHRFLRHRLPHRRLPDRSSPRRRPLLRGLPLFLVMGFGMAFLPGPAGAVAAALEGTLGLTAAALFDADQTSKRGDLVILEVWDGTPAAAAGLQRGDVIVAIDGVPVAGKDASQAFKSQLHASAGGPGGPGSKVHLTLVRPAEGMRQLKVDLQRVALPIRQNPAFETFGYRVPRSWRVESYSFPLPWSPRLAYQGMEDVLFVPDFTDRKAPGYHGLVWVWWLDGHPAVDAAMLQRILIEYFRGLSQERGTNNKFTPRLENVTARVSAAAGAPAGTAFRGEAVTYNPQGELITLQVEVELPRCPDAGHEAILFRLATQPPATPIWKDLRTVTGTFRCRRAA